MAKSGAVKSHYFGGTTLVRSRDCLCTQSSTMFKTQFNLRSKLPKSKLEWLQSNSDHSGEEGVVWAILYVRNIRNRRFPVEPKSHCSATIRSWTVSAIPWELLHSPRDGIFASSISFFQIAPVSRGEKTLWDQIKTAERRWDGQRRRHEMNQAVSSRFGSGKFVDWKWKREYLQDIKLVTILERTRVFGMIN